MSVCYRIWLPAKEIEMSGAVWAMAREVGYFTNFINFYLT